VDLYQNMIKQDQQGNATFNERKSHMTHQQEPISKKPNRTANKAEHGHAVH
jgi:hypothetical protein